MGRIDGPDPAATWKLHTSGRSPGSVYFHRSSDMGWTWGEPEPVDISALAYSTHVGKMGAIDMPDGSLLAPFDGWTAADARQMGPDRSMGSRFFVARSSDGGRTWGQPSTVPRTLTVASTSGSRP